MENLNLVEILKDCPKGTKLYSPVLGECALEEVIDSNDYPIKVKYKIINNDTRVDYFTKNGYLLLDKPDAECMLFPSKGQRDWSKLIVPKFKVGDSVQSKIDNNVKFTITNIDNNKFYYGCEKGHEFMIPVKKQDNWELVSDEIKPKFKVGDKIRHKDGGVYCTLGEYSEGISAYRTNIGLSLTYKDMEQWELVPNKFDINTLIPYESKVLIRSTIGSYWQPAFWGAYIIDTSDGLHHHDYLTTRGFTPYCIPYDGNEHLIGKTDDCCDFYKTWEE